MTPLTVLPIDAAGLVVMVLLVVAVLAIPLFLGVRDWRCVAMVLLWPPVISAIQTANVSILFALASALVWRYRERHRRPGTRLGLALAAKFLLWPVAVWLAVERRLAAVAWAAVSCGVLLLGSWAVVGFDGFGAIPSLLRRLSDVMDETWIQRLRVAARSRGASTGARALDRGRGRRHWSQSSSLAGGATAQAFILAIAASLAFTPVVWLHYFALLVVVVALAQPRLGVVWLVPLGLFVTPGSGDPRRSRRPRRSASRRSRSGSRCARRSSSGARLATPR